MIDLPVLQTILQTTIEKERIAEIRFLSLNDMQIIAQFLALCPSPSTVKFIKCKFNLNLN